MTTPASVRTLAEVVRTGEPTAARAAAAALARLSPTPMIANAVVGAVEPLIKGGRLEDAEARELDGLFWKSVALLDDYGHLSDDIRAQARRMAHAGVRAS
jgi:hypothetical protein